MTVKKQPEFGAGELREAASDWFRQFLKHLEINMAETGQALQSDSNTAIQPWKLLNGARGALLLAADPGTG